MPSVSQAQQALMGQAYAIKTGKMKPSDLNPDYKDQILDLAKSMSEKDLKDFAETPKKDLPKKIKENYIMKNIKSFEAFVNESIEVNEGHPSVDPYAWYSSMAELKQDLKQTKDQFKGKDIPEWAQKRIEFLEDGIKNKVIKEAMDTKYWAEYNLDSSGQSISLAVSEWNAEAEGAENRIKGNQIKMIKKLAQEFFKIEKWISVNVIQAMIMHES